MALEHEKSWQLIERVATRLSGTLAREGSRIRIDLPPQPVSAETMGVTSAGDLARFIDHTLLKPEATREQIENLCREAIEYEFFAVCVNSVYVPFCAELLGGSPVKVCTVVGFPLGASSSEAKAFEASDAAAKGADELDMVINIGRLKSGEYAAVHDDVRGVVDAAAGRPVKAIIETALVSDEEKVIACLLARAAGASFVKTSTGFAASGAKIEDVRLMRASVGPRFGVKAAGGIRDTGTAVKMLSAGATRLGTSASIAIVGGTVESV